MSRKRLQTEKTIIISKRTKENSAFVSFNDDLKGHMVSKLEYAWKNNSKFTSKGKIKAEVCHEPFKHCEIKNFLNTEQNAVRIRSSLEACEMSEVHNDMYKFSQSEDLHKFVGNSVLESFKKFMYGECRQLIQKITGIPLNNKVAVTCSVYEFTNFLLCHDDRCEDRRIAFILYLSDEWSQEYGGALQMFNSTAEGRPSKIVRNIYPEFNKFVFFEVSEKSFHQVQEVLAQNQFRVSVNGWFHGPIIKTNRSLIIPPEPLLLDPLDVKSDMGVFLNDLYQDEEILKTFCTRFKSDFCIGLGEFFEEDWKSVFVEDLKKRDVQWSEARPPNWRKFDICVTESLSANLQRLLLMMRSYDMFSFISKVAGYILEPEQAKEVCFSLSKTRRNTPQQSKREAESEPLPKCRFEIQRWKNGCYSVLQDGDFDRDFSVLEAYIFLNVEELDPDTHGGNISYVAKGEEDVLATIEPSDNSMIVAYKNKNVACFTTYINSCFTKSFYIIKFTYGS